MSDMPNTMKLGMGCAFLGAIVAFASMAAAWNGTVDSAALVGVDMAAAMMFFAVAGSFSTYSPVKGNTVVVLSALATAVPIIAGIFGAMGVLFTLICAVLGIVCIVIASMQSTREYVDNSRVV